jgi:predicted Rossmann fold flavoprotein
VASAGNQSFREKMLFTHRGLSGPAILQISSYWRHGKPISIDLAPDQKITASFSDPKVSRNLNAAKTALENALPNRLADRWLEVHAPQTWTNAGLEDFERQIHRWQIMPAGTEGYEKAEVTAGGVDTDELSAKTMECRNVAGLYFIGEVVDVTGHLGGFNFQWAWASGAAAGRSI